MQCDQCGPLPTDASCTCLDPDVTCLHEMLLDGAQGLASYAYQARRLGKTDVQVDSFIQQALFATVAYAHTDPDALFDLVLECGRMSQRVMELLDAGHTQTFGLPIPTTVDEGTKSGPGILVTGHDLLDLYQLLEQSAQNGVNVYTHGEMLPAHGYPKLWAHRHLAGHFGSAWHHQHHEFSQFSGPMLVTSNCVVPPAPEYSARMFTTSMTSIPGVKRLANGDFSPVIERALSSPPLEEKRTGQVMTGFHHNVLIRLIDSVVDAIQSGEIRHVYLIGGCETGEDNLSRHVSTAGSDSLLLTLGCGKYRLREQNFGRIAGLPRLLDVGQCNDAYGAVQVVQALANYLGCELNDLPLTVVLPWFEQKSVALMLTLLSMGMQGIQIEGRPPAYLTGNILQRLSDRFGVQFPEQEQQQGREQEAAQSEPLAPSRFEPPA